LVMLGDKRLSSWFTGGLLPDGDHLLEACARFAVCRTQACP
jgi:hypothetical protein